MNMRMRYIPRCVISGSYSSSIFSFFGNLKIVLQSGRTNLHSHPQCTGLFFLHALTNTGYLMQSVVIIINSTSKLLEDEI